METSTSVSIASLAEAFRERKGVWPRVFAAPGRVNLIGEHTDYNGGFVFPAAIDLRTVIAVHPRSDRRLQLYSEAFAEEYTVDLAAGAPVPLGHWTDYVVGVAWALEEAGYAVPGAEVWIRAGVPLGSGLSSSAALEVSAALALASLGGHAPDRTELALLCQRAENEFVGMRCGVMDQFAACWGKRGSALLLDCRSLEFRHVPLPADVRIVICNTMVRHQLAGSEYNQRRASCEGGVRNLRVSLPEVTSLRDVTCAQLGAERDRLDPLVYRRCRHVVSENERVLAAAEALERGDTASFGDLMGASHRSLRDDYEVSCAELDLMVELASDAPGVIGSRMTGGGFGGCTVNLVEADRVNAFRDHLANAYERATGMTPQIYACLAMDGACEELPGE